MGGTTKWLGFGSRQADDGQEGDEENNCCCRLEQETGAGFTVRQVIVMCLGFVIALTCGSPNAWALTSPDMQDDLNLTDHQTNLITSFGLVGLFFTFFAGIVYDRVGVSKMLFFGGILTSGGYMVMSFGSNSSWLMILFAFMVVGFASGGAFVSTLGAGIKIVSQNPGTAVAVIGGGMSLSMAFVTVVFLVLREVGCDGTCDDGIWRTQLRVLSIICAVVQIPSAFVFRILDEPAAQTKEKQGVIQITDKESYNSFNQRSDDDEEADEIPNISSPLTTEGGDYEEPFLNKFRILKGGFFWCISLTYMTGVGGSLVIITQMTTIWDEFVEGSDHDRSNWIFSISLSFSLVNCFIGGMLFGAVADHMVNGKGIPRTKVVAVVFAIFSVIFYALGWVSIVQAPSSFVEILFMLLLISCGIPFGVFVTSFPTIVGESYPIQNFGINLGLVQISIGVATFVVPVLCTTVANQTGNYALVFLLFAIGYFVSAVSLFFVNPPPPQQIEQPADHSMTDF